jgi:uncharacterized protein (TIGR00266 family)
MRRQNGACESSDNRDDSRDLAISLHTPMKTWHYLNAQNQQQQTDEGALASLVTQGIMTPATLVWSQGMSGWINAQTALPQLFSASPPAVGGAVPPPMPLQQSASSATPKCHVLDFEILGDDMQIVEIELDPGETVIAEAGGMNYMEEDINFEAKMGDGSAPGGGFFNAIKSVGKRVLTGESIFMTHFTHRGSSKKRRVAFSAPYPGKIIALKMAELGGEILCEKGAFLCAAFGTSVGIAFNKKLGAGFFGGEGFILQRLRGDGMAFLHSGGTIVKKELKGETLRVDTGCIVAFTNGIQYDIERAGGLKSMFFGGEGLFLATLRGHGTVWLQSLPFSRMADRVLAHAPANGGSSVGEGSVLGGIGRMLGGD